MAHTLFVIEAPGKVESMTKILSEIPRLGAFKVVATKGHFWRMPEALDPLCIDENLQETERHPHEFTKSLLLDGAAGAKEVVLATDADAEGEVIARDAWLIVRELCPKVTRMQFRAVASEAVVEAFSQRAAFNPSLAISGDTRRILDRIMGAALSDKDAGFFSGRVQAAMLAGLSKKEAVIGEAHVHLPAADGGRPFVAKIAYTRSQRERVQQIVEAAAKVPAVAVAKVEVKTTKKPLSFGAAVVEVNKATGMPVGQVAQVMQGLYERGRMSYPRSSAQAIHASTLSTLERIAKKHKIRFDTQSIPTIVGNGIDGVTVSHPSPAPLVDVDVTAVLRTMAAEERVLAVLTRGLIESGVPRPVERPDVASGPEWLQHLEFERVSKPLPWEKLPAAGLKQLDQQAALVQFMVSAGIGRPSTLVSHAEKFASRGLVDAELGLTEKGREWLQKLPPTLLRVSPQMLEQAFDLLRGSAPERVRMVVAMMGDAGVELAKRFEEVSGKSFPELPDHAQMQMTSQKLSQDIKRRKDMEAGLLRADKVERQEGPVSQVGLDAKLR